MSKAFIGKTLTILAFAVYGLFMIDNAMTNYVIGRYVGAFPFFIGFFLVWLAIYLPLNKRGYFDWHNKG